MADRNTSVTVLVGVDKISFILSNSLAPCSSFFLSTLRSGFKETQEQVVLLSKVDAETLLVVTFMYTLSFYRSRMKRSLNESQSESQ
jgi:hypothetical protein